MNILIVDDEQHILKSMENKVGTLLPQADRAAFTKASEAMEYVRNNQIDIAFLDINMRFISGIEMGKEIQKLWPHANLIFCTGYEEYALEAIGLNCSQYLVKPVSEDKLRDAINDLRYPINDNKCSIEIKCFGNFEVYCDGEPIHFKYSKSKELLAYLVDRGGVDVNIREAMAVLFDEDKISYMGNVRRDLIETLNSLGHGDIIRVYKGNIGIEKSLVKCDYYDYLDHINNSYNGEYMSQYSWAEYTLPRLGDN